VLSGKAAFPPQVALLAARVPGFVLYPQPVSFVQRPAEVLLIWQSDSMVRPRLSDSQDTPHPKPSWFANPSAITRTAIRWWWITIGLTPRLCRQLPHTPYRPASRSSSATNSSNAETRIEVTVTVEDPGAHDAWSAQQIYRRVEVGPMGESTCAEGNFNYFTWISTPCPGGKARFPEL